MVEYGIHARVVKPSELTEDEISAWERFCAHIPSLSSPFLSLHYARAVAESGIDVRVCVLYHDGSICGFLPYQFRNHFSAWSKSAEPVGGQMTDYFGLVAEPGLRVTSGQLLRLAQLSHLGFSHLDESQLEYGLVAEQPRVGLRVRLQTGAERPLDALLSERRKYLKDTDRRARQLCNEVGPIRFTFDIQHNRSVLLTKLIDEKRSQYLRTNVPDPLRERWTHALLHALSEYRFKTCRGVLSAIWAGDHWVAIHFGILGSGVLQYWLPVYNPAFSKYAPGRLLIHHIIDSAHTASIHTIDRGEGDSSSKRELANEEHRFFRGAWYNKSVASGIARGLHSIKWRLGS